MDKRRSIRQAVAYPVRIRTGPDREPLPCMLADISAHGAQLVVDAAVELPPRLELLLAGGSEHARPCLVVRRKGDRLGLRFAPRAGPMSGP